MRAIAMIVLLTACSASVELAPPRIRGRMGPAHDRAIKRVLAMPATCGSFKRGVVNAADPMRPGGTAQAWEPVVCSEEAAKGADAVIRSGLAMRGMNVIDSERVNAVTATRLETSERGQDVTSTTTETTGARFEDATPLQQAAIITELGADGLLATRIWITSSFGLSTRRTVHVQVRLLATADQALVWARRCDLEVGGMLLTEGLAIERAARCAIEGAAR